MSTSPPELGTHPGEGEGRGARSGVGVQPGTGAPLFPPRPRQHSGGMDRDQLADFLRRRREALQPEDVGLGRGPRRRTAGLRREEVAALCDMSVDYYGRLEQRRGPQRRRAGRTRRTRAPP